MVVWPVFVGHYCRAKFYTIGNDLVERISCCVLGDCQAYSAFAFGDTDNRRFAACATATHAVVLLAADVGFICFDDITKQITASGFLDAVAYTLQHEPGGLLGNAEILSELD